MSPPSREINGPRPAPLRIHKDSHLIHKQPTTTSSSIAASHPQQRHQPVIIYTHSPKVIHTQAQNFMALVQKLTGLSHSKDDEPRPPPPRLPDIDNKPAVAAAVHDESPSSSENSGASLPLLGFDPLPQSHFLPEMPLFTPNSSDFFCSPSNFYRYPESSTVFSSPSPGVGSPLFIEAMRAFTDY